MTFLNMIHFERPYWLLLLPIIWVIFVLVQYRSGSRNALDKAIDQSLLVHLEYKGEQRSVNKWIGLLCFSICWVGLSGISWTRAPSTMFESTSKTVLVVDQSLSMYSTDIKPDRETELKQTVQDILSQSKDGDIALVAFAGDAYTISPFSQDRDTIRHFLLALDPLIMPLYGSNLTSGVQQALSLLPSKRTPVHLIVLTDSLDATDESKIPELLDDYNAKLDLIAVGTQKGGPIELPDGRILKSKGQRVIPTVPIDQLKSLTENVKGHFYHCRLSQAELGVITGQSGIEKNTEQADNKSINWIDQGQWLAFPFLLWLAFQFRRGMLVILLLGIFILPSNKASASPLDWFKTQDQQGQEAVNQGDWKSAAEHFQRPDWKAASSYALGHYDQAAKSLEAMDNNTARSNYNLGNALALSGKEEDAISAYKRALELDPTFKEAKENLDYLEKQQKKKQQNQSKGNQSDQNKDPKNQKPSDKDASNNSDNKNQTSNNKKDDKKSEKQDKKQSSEDNKQNKPSPKDEQQQESKPQLNNEQKQALNQWLRQIQDNPGTLLQRKLWYLHQEELQDSRYSQKEEQNPW